MSPARRRPPKASWTLVPLFIVLLLAVAGIGVAGWVHGLKQRAAAEEDSSPSPSAVGDGVAAGGSAGAPADPFASVPDEDPHHPSKRPERIEGTPEGIEAEPLWRDALVLADQGWTLAEEAVVAKRHEDWAVYNSKGAAARKAFDEALESTAEWELAILEEHGETDPAVRTIVRTRSEWFDQLRVLRKTHESE